jgi:hypothetical protein
MLLNDEMRSIKRDRGEYMDIGSTCFSLSTSVYESSRKRKRETERCRNEPQEKERERAKEHSTETKRISVE